MRALVPSETVPHPSLAKASDTFSRKREKGRARPLLHFCTPTIV
jgi:hypothetical protein